MKNYILLGLIFVSLLFSCSNEKPTSISVHCDKTDITALSAKEIQRYVYLRTGTLLPIEKKDDSNNKTIKLLTDSSLDKEEYYIKNIDGDLVICGGSETALLYGAYSYAELLGVRFHLHGDVIPDTPYKGSLLSFDKSYKPLFEVRGLLPFHDFPEGPDLWCEDTYKSAITQMVKMRMNFFSLHTYPYVEPNVWIGLPEDVSDNGDVLYSYPTTLANTSRNGAWGYSAMNTSDYSCGAGELFPADTFASPILKDCLPYPKTAEQNNLIFNRTGEIFDNAFSMGQKMGMKFCIGVETPIGIPQPVRDRLKEKDLDFRDTEARKLVYDGIFTRIKKRHPIDYFWLWTPEEWTWGTPSKESIEHTLEDVDIARNVLTQRGNDMGFGLSGWVLGPPNNTTLFDDYLPKNDFMTSLARLCGQERIDLGYSKLKKDRKSYPILWLEDDPALTTPQLWVGRMRSDMAESLACGSSGIIGCLWRSRSIAPNIRVMAEACWDQSQWNKDLGKPFEYIAAPTNDIRTAGVGTNYYHGIKGSEDSYLYNTQRYGLESYKVKVPNGKYRVIFQFCETKYKGPNARIFNLEIEDQAVCENIDVYEAVGADTVYIIKSEEVKVNDNSLDIVFQPIKGETFMSAFVIEGKTDDANQIKGTPYKRGINVGGGLYKDYEADLSETIGNKSAKPRDLSSTSFYADYATHEFGENVAKEIAEIFESLDGTEGSDGQVGMKMPRPAGWITGPGTIKPNEAKWEEESRKYAFVDKLESLRSKVKGTGNKERFDYWLNTFMYQRAMGEIGCIRGEMDSIVTMINKVDDLGKKKQIVESELKPLRLELARGWEQMMNFLINTVSNVAEMGTVMNIESQSRKTYNFVNKYDKLIESITSKPLAGEYALSSEYKQAPRFIILNYRNVLEKDENYTLRVVIPGYKAEGPAPVFNYRNIGSGEYKKITMTHLKNNLFEISIPKSEQSLEYYLTVDIDNERISYPSTSPKINQTIINF